MTLISVSVIEKYKCLPPSQVTPPNEPEKQPPPKNACTKLFENCKSRMCSCCMKNEKSELANNTEGGVGCFGCVKKRHEPANIIIENETDEKPVGCFSCSKKEQEPARIIIENETDKKPKLLDRLKCCKSQKVGDMNCFPKGKRKENWAERRDSIMSTSTASRPKYDCRSILRKMFCLNRCCKRKGIEDLVRQPSIVSKKKSLTPTTALPTEDTSPKIDLSLVEHSSHMRAAIPILPICLAWFCLVMNCIAPGTGTVFSGMFCLCIGIPRFSQKDGPRPRIGSFIINIIIGIGQFFTVLFCLVGWGWSIWWGVIMLKIARKHKKFKHFEAIEQASSMPPVHPNSRQPVQQKRT